MTEAFNGKSEEEGPDDGSGILARGVDHGALEEVEDTGAALEEGGREGGREGGKGREAEYLKMLDYDF